jgi:hypothetical protein
MNESTININVRAFDSSTNRGYYNTVVLKPYTSNNPNSLNANESLAEQIHEADTKYVIKWIYDLRGATITIPRNCILEFDGGQFVGSGTLVSSNNDTKIVNLYDYNVIGNGVTLSGDFQKFTGEYVNV